MIRAAGGAATEQAPAGSTVPGDRPAPRGTPCNSAECPLPQQEMHTMRPVSLHSPRATRRPAGRRPRTFAPRLEVLEGRDVPSTLTVTNNFDNGAGSLRYAIGHAR